MLHYSTIHTETLELLRKLHNIDFFQEMRLVGGTALALQIGHRKSIDIDLFGHYAVDEFEVSNQLKQLGTFRVIKKSENILICIINDIKVDIVKYPYPWLHHPVKQDGLLLASSEDIAAMKLSAVTGKGSKKDFIDIYFLLQQLSLEKMLQLYEKKYDDGNPFLVLKGLLYFEDAETEQSPVMLKPIDWELVKTFIKTQVDNIR